MPIPYAAKGRFDAACDKEIFGLIVKEYERQMDHLEMIASENYPSSAVMTAMGSVLTAKYAEAIPATATTVVASM